MQTQKEHWNPAAAYQAVCKTIEGWPVWKKQAYNAMFTSRHAKPIPIQLQQDNKESNAQPSQEETEHENICRS